MIKLLNEIFVRRIAYSILWIICFPAILFFTLVYGHKNNRLFSIENLDFVFHEIEEIKEHPEKVEMV